MPRVIGVRLAGRAPSPTFVNSLFFFFALESASSSASPRASKASRSAGNAFVLVARDGFRPSRDVDGVAERDLRPTPASTELVDDSIAVAREERFYPKSERANSVMRDDENYVRRARTTNLMNSSVSHDAKKPALEASNEERTSGLR